MTQAKRTVKESIRSVVAEAVANGLDECRDAAGTIDKACLHLEVEKAIAGHPAIDRAITVQLRYSFVERLIGECLRGTKADFPTPPVAPSASAALWDTEELRMVVQVPKQGRYDAKRRIDLDIPEVDAMIAYLETLAESYARDVAWYRAVKARWVQLGLPETATVRDVLGL